MAGGGYSYIRENLRYENHVLHYSKKDEELFDLHIKECHKQDNSVDESVMLSDWLDSNYEYPDYFDIVSRAMIKSVEHKKMINRIYSDIPGSMDLGYCNWRYQILLENSRECIDELFERGLFCSYHYKSLGNGYFTDVCTPNNNWLEAHVINLFNDFRYTEVQARKTAEILAGIGRSALRDKS